VTKLSLLLKVLEEESEEHVSKQLKISAERALPSLHRNIRCGNSLVAPDYFDLKQEHPFNMRERKRTNAFDWQAEFSDVMKAGGFDVVIGNPPYVRQESLKDQKNYYQSHYAVYQGTADLYAYFIEKGISLLRPGGIFSYIVANKWMRANYGKPLRKFLLTKQIEEIVDFGDLPVFKSATTYPCILRVRNAKPAKEICISKVETLDFPDLADYVQTHRHPIEQATLTDGGWTLGDKRTELLLKKLKSVGRSLDDYIMGDDFRGIITGLTEAFVIDVKIKNKIIEEDSKSADLIKPFLLGKNIKRYNYPQSEKFLIFIPKGWTNSQSGETKNKWKWFRENYPVVAQHLASFQEAADIRCDKGDYWWELRACEYYDEFEKPKIIYPEICSGPQFTFDDSQCFANNKCFIMPRADKYLLGILNSKLTNFLFETNLPKLRGGFFMPAYVVLKNFPIYVPDFDKLADKTRHDKMVSLVTHILELNRYLPLAKTDQERRLVQQEIDATDVRIDALVYELYGLTPEEIAVVEGVRFGK